MATGSVSGPLFDGQAEAALRRGIDEIRRRLAAEGEKLAAAAFAESIRNDHGKFTSHFTSTSRSRTYTTQSGTRSYSMAVVADRASETVVVNDLVTYGAWLEGVGSRNASTRFKGYHGFRRAAQQLDRSAYAIADEVLTPYTREMNG